MSRNDDESLDGYLGADPNAARRKFSPTGRVERGPNMQVIPPGGSREEFLAVRKIMREALAKLKSGMDKGPGPDSDVTLTAAEATIVYRLLSEHLGMCPF